MTTEQKQTLADLFNAYIKAKEAYDIEVGDNYIFRQNWITASNYGGLVQNGDAKHWEEMMKASNESLTVKKGRMDRAYAAYETLQNDLSEADKAEFLAANPTLGLQIQEAEIKAKTETDKANFMSQRAKYIIVGIVVLVVVATVLYFKFRKKA